MRELLDTCFEHQPTMVTRRIAGEILLVPVNRQVREEACLFTLDDTAAFLWEQIDGKQPGLALIEKLAKEYEIDSAQAEKDVCAFLTQLKEIDAIREVKGGEKE